MAIRPAPKPTPTTTEKSARPRPKGSKSKAQKAQQAEAAPASREEWFALFLKILNQYKKRDEKPDSFSKEAWAKWQGNVQAEIEGFNLDEDLQALFFGLLYTLEKEKREEIAQQIRQR